MYREKLTRIGRIENRFLYKHREDRMLEVYLFMFDIVLNMSVLASCSLFKLFLFLSLCICLFYLSISITVFLFLSLSHTHTLTLYVCLSLDRSFILKTQLYKGYSSDFFANTRHTCLSNDARSSRYNLCTNLFPERSFSAKCTRVATNVNKQWRFLLAKINKKQEKN